MRANTRLFGCRDPTPTKPFVIKETPTLNQSSTATANELLNYMFGALYKTLIIVFVVFVVLTFICLPIFEEFISVFETLSKSSDNQSEVTDNQSPKR